MNSRSSKNFIVSLLIIFHTSPVIAASKLPVRSAHGMVVTSHELASQVGVDILKKGGNAVDAAVAVGFALAVVHPAAGNLGGGGFMVLRFPDGTATTIDFREKAPLKAQRNMFLNDRGEIISNLSLTGYLASGVPGTVAGLTMALDNYGSMKLADIIKPAIALAEHGFSVSYQFAQDLVRLQNEFQQFPAAARTFLTPDGAPYRAGELFKQPQLARTLQLIAANGAKAFYVGTIAELIATDMSKNGGLITKEDLAAYCAIERPPVIGHYHDYEIISMGPPSSGGIALIQSLNILENFELHALGYHSSPYIHVLTETWKMVFCDRAQFLADDDFTRVPVAELISKDYAQQLTTKIKMAVATPAHQINPGLLPAGEGNHTTHYSIVDENQMAVAVTTTINSGYGSKVVIDGAGFLMNNEMDDFAIKSGAPNAYGLVSYEANEIEPGKRMLSSMTPTIILKDGKLFLILGGMGGSRIITSVVQIVLNIIEFEMTVQEAVAAPRLHHQWLPDTLRHEKYALAHDIIDHLIQLGHQVADSEDYCTEAHAIMVDPAEKIYLGAADPRYEGKAVGY